MEERLDAELQLGHRGVVSELETLVAAHPLRERLRGLLMLALYRSGRQAEALRVYRDGRRILGEELGLDPDPELQRLEAAILTQDPSLDGPGSAQTAGPAPPPRFSVPVPLTPLIGRDAELSELTALAGRHRLLTLVGPGGVGKTRLALELAQTTGAGLTRRRLPGRAGGGRRPGGGAQRHHHCRRPHRSPAARRRGSATGSCSSCSTTAST